MALSNKQLIAKAEAWWELYADRIADLLGIPDGYSMPKFVVKDLGPGGKASTDPGGTVINLDPDWFGDHPNDKGGLVHEAVHALQNLAPGEKSKYVEDIADAIRAKLGLTYPGWEPSKLAASLAELPAADLTTINRKMQNGTLSKAELQAVLKDEAPADGGGTEPQGAGPLRPYDVPRPVGATPDGGSVPGGAVFDINDPNAIPPFSATGAWEWNAGSGVWEFKKGAAEDDGKMSPERKAQWERHRALLKQQRERKRHQAQRDRRKAFLNQLQQWGIPVNSNLTELIQGGAIANWNQSTFLFYLRKTPEYREAFPGIFDKNGTLKMSEGAYLQTQQRFEDIATQNGLQFNDKKSAWLFRNDVSPAEYGDRAPAMARLQRNPELYRAFSAEIVQGGLAKPGEITKGELFKFVLGEGNKQWYDLWQDAVTRNAAVQAGINIAKRGDYTSLGHQLIEKISAKGLTEAQLQQGFQQLGDTLLDVLPAAKQQGYNLHKGVVTQAVFGGKNAADSRKLLKHILDTEDAFWGEQRAAQPTYASEGGGIQTQGSRTRTYTE